VPIEQPDRKLAKLPWAHLRLPPFPQVAMKVLGLASQENVQLHQLCDLISSDAAFAGEVLIVANSLLYAPRYPVRNILQALVVLGADALQGMCMTVGVRAYLGRSMHYAAMRGLWRHNLACALIAQRLAAAGSLDKDAAYTAGIMHDVGRVALSVIQPRDYANLLESHCGSPQSMLALEEDLFGWDHCETGQRLISDWKLPAELDAVVGDHHAPPRQDSQWGMAELIKVSCRMADSIGFPAFPGCEGAPYGELLELLPTRERLVFYPAHEPLIAEIAAAIHDIESL
jgi:HD-like signal output (HDOD) protein